MHIKKTITLVIFSFVLFINSIFCSTDPSIIVVFGASGDLTARKLIPAFYNLMREGHLSENTAIVGVGRNVYNEESFRQKMGEAIEKFSRTKQLDIAFWEHFKNKISYIQVSFDEDTGYDKLQEHLLKIDQDFGTQGNRLYYLSTPPSFFSLITEKLHEHQLIYNCENSKEKWSRVIIEKPFGSNLDTAIDLQQRISKYLQQSQIYRMDHYLGKEGVQNLFTLRFENALLEPIWNNEYIDNIQITLSEEIGIGTRASFWEETGALRDIFQNHLMQLLAIVAMEPPTTLNSQNIHTEKMKVLNAIRSFPLAELDNHVIRGQYGSGTIQGSPVVGYFQENGVLEASAAETFVAAKIYIDNERWNGVPFYIRGGKRLPKQTTEIVVTFKAPTNQSSNALFIRIQPNTGVFFRTLSKVPGLNRSVKPIVFGYGLDSFFGISSPEAYEKLIYDCIRGDRSLFVEAEEQFAAWRLLTPVLEYWRIHSSEKIPAYDAGTWGPSGADLLLMENGHEWTLLEK